MRGLIIIELWVVWLIVAGLLLILELTTLTFYLIWFMVGSIAAGIISFIYPDQFWLQLAVGCIISLLLLIFTKPLTAKLRQSRGFVDSTTEVINKIGVVLEHISVDTTGIVKINGDTWSAKSEESLVPGDRVIVLYRSGLTLIVEKYIGGN